LLLAVPTICRDADPAIWDARRRSAGSCGSSGSRSGAGIERLLQNRYDLLGQRWHVDRRRGVDLQHGAEPHRFLELVEGGHRQRSGDVDRVWVRPGAAACVPLGRLLDGKSAVHLDRTRRQCPQR